jgi:hypothetical protein
MRALGLAAVLVGVVVAQSFAGAREIQTRVVVCTTTRSHLATAQPARQNLAIFNAGTLHVSVGRGLQMTTIHAGTGYEFVDYQGGLECQTQGGTGSTAVEVLETIK